DRGIVFALLCREERGDQWVRSPVEKARGKPVMLGQRHPIPVVAQGNGGVLQSPALPSLQHEKVVARMKGGSSGFGHELPIQRTLATKDPARIRTIGRQGIVHLGKRTYASLSHRPALHAPLDRWAATNSRPFVPRSPHGC